jgi:colanic acid/amylovoran biosynthesis glycosyltransferase
MTAADVVIVPSVTSSSGEKEGLPVVIMEAMATGVPVVASDHSGIPEIVRPGHTGELTPEKDARKIAQAIARVLSRDNSAMIAAARKLVVEEFNIVGVAQQRRALFLGYDET